MATALRRWVGPMHWPHRLAPIDCPIGWPPSVGPIGWPRGLGRSVAAPRLAARQAAAGATGSRLQLGIPVEIVEPALVQVIGGEQSAVAVEFKHRGPVGQLARLHA